MRLLLLLCYHTHIMKSYHGQQYNPQKMTFDVSVGDCKVCHVTNYVCTIIILMWCNCFWMLVCLNWPCSEDPLEYFNREVQKRRDEETNLWSEPGDPSHSERDDDRALHVLLQARNKTRMGSTVCDRGKDTKEQKDTKKKAENKLYTIIMTS